MLIISAAVSIAVGFCGGCCLGGGGGGGFKGACAGCTAGTLICGLLGLAGFFYIYMYLGSMVRALFEPAPAHANVALVALA